MSFICTTLHFIFKITNSGFINFCLTTEKLRYEKSPDGNEKGLKGFVFFLRYLRKNIGRNPPISQLPGVIPSFTQRTWFSTSITYDARWDGYIILAACAQDQGLNARSCHHDCDLSLSQDWRGTPNWNLASCVKKIKCTS